MSEFEPGAEIERSLSYQIKGVQSTSTKVGGFDLSSGLGFSRPLDKYLESEFVQ